VGGRATRDATDAPDATEEDGMRLEVVQDVAAPRETVWAVLTDWERQSEWMLDAKAVHVLTPQREGVGVTIRCPTNLFGVTVQDVMRVTEWEEPTRLGVTHLGKIITGSGAFDLVALGPERTRVRWWEEVDPPLGAVGEWGASTFVLPLIQRIFRRSLANLGRIAEQEHARAVG
jgi:carbon monoxide dehydrogenase subunit G